MGGFSEFFKGKKPRIEYSPYGAFTPEQKALSQNLGTQFNVGVGGQQPSYQGQYASPVTSAEQEAIDRTSRLSALGESGLAELMSGKFPEEYFQTNVQDPLMKTWREDIQPLIQEQYSGPGEGYWGSARAGAVSKGLRDTMDTLAAKRSELALQAKQWPLQAAGAMSTMSEAERAAQSLPRLVKQYGLDQQYAEWVRGREEGAKYIDQALSFLNIGSVTREEYAGEPGVFDSWKDFGKKLLSPQGIASLVTGGMGGGLSSGLGGNIGQIAAA